MTPLKVSLLGTFTTAFVARMLDLFLLDMGIDATIDEAPYGGMVEHALNPRSSLYEGRPGVVVILAHEESVRDAPRVFASDDEAAALARAEADRWASLWDAIHRQLPAAIIQGNIPLPDASPTGSLDGAAAWGRVRYIRRVNEELARRARPGVTLFDIEYLTASYGLRRAIDHAAYQLSKQPFSFDFLPTCCHRLARLVAATQGRARKCVVVDLDDTLWGGTVGEDGADALAVGPDSADGEAFSSFQRYLRDLRERGILLAVCSKNDDSVARAAFAARVDMPLRIDDFACFVANWDDKASNVQRIASALNIGLDSLVFIDNSAEERELIRRALPEVTVVDLPDDPVEYVRAVDRSALFELTEISGESALRTKQMHEEQARQGVAASFVDYDAYLESLALEARFHPIDADTLPRVAELIQRTNQFNLRSVRHSAEQVRQFVATYGNVGFAVSLADRFGSQGTISVVLLQNDGDTLFVDTWLMSCRVLKRGVEGLVANRIVAEARRLGARAVIGEYRPTAKNGMVADHYPTLGYALDSEVEGHKRYRLDIHDGTAPQRHFIKEASAR
ncbi:MAG: HAD-IIIC family phosphatase [Deltaproteobacteria bacterium]|nr:HAD-IIIC family phosphatase [Deltaproteobacteria bacterium]